MFLACINLSLFCHYLVLALRSVNAFYNTCSSYVSVKLSSLFLRSFDNCDVYICIKYLLGMLWFWNLQIISVTALNQYLLMWLQKVCINVLLTWCVSAFVSEIMRGTCHCARVKRFLLPIDVWLIGLWRHFIPRYMYIT